MNNLIIESVVTEKLSVTDIDAWSRVSSIAIRCLQAKSLTARSLCAIAFLPMLRFRNENISWLKYLWKYFTRNCDSMVKLKAKTELFLDETG